MPDANDYHITTIITQDDPKLLVEQANKLSNKLRSDEATKTQVRSLFGTLRQVELLWPIIVDDEKKQKKRDEAYRELILFGPRLSYQANRHPTLQELATTLQKGIQSINKEDRNTMKRLVEFFEAVVAYYGK
jgi:CRISPR-associated protein Csm2